ncbi:uncharacterized protein HMPREF1541_05436 [Cyphellophora europaea CBS 101466]|uniref:Uncharacterized protein n=1 Tax=Cyphellophora europaea (strain CBS 101466) TaxID=1220924 RepID=W2RTX0_CYPE1|nr:uncharacterized protein HMPREF1541_05436 [Cyphellophora europaea CBS 101466]ETN39213.1 hypothetical protein HMPREF1541_05436 [Cyphellophora europaea CBS 101466]
MAYSLHATEPLDYIHALRALIPKNEALPAADYAQKYDAACITHSRWLVHEGYAHDILCSGALWLELSAKIPSWTMTFGRPPRSRTRTGQVTYYEDPTLYVNDGTTPAVQAAQWQAEGLHMNWKATGETIDFQHVLPVAVSLIWPSIPRSSASIEDDALRIGGFQLDSLADIDANSFYAYRTRRVVSGLHLVWEFYKQTAVRQTNEVESFVERAGWWEEFNMSEGPRVNRGGLFGAESILFYTSGAAAADMAPCAARLAKHGDLRNYQQTDSTQSSSAVRSSSVREVGQKQEIAIGPENQAGWCLA